MTVITDIHNPTFSLFPVNNNRTAWRPVSLPVVLVVPHNQSANSEAFNVRIFIENVPQEALVAGLQNIGRRYPDRELYSQTISTIALGKLKLDPHDFAISRDGVSVDLADAVSGDLITYTTKSGITDTITYLVDADYYDLSDSSIEVESLPSDQYNLIYEAQYFKRLTSYDGHNDFLCIDLNTTALASLKFKIDHPGKVIDEFYRLSPPPYLTNSSKAKDTTVAFYRPFTDMLQDVMDEQSLLERINWVFEAPPEMIPYLSSLLGWDIPYFPESLDQLRRAVLRRTVEFQNLKGSRRAIINVFKLFGFEVLISNLWWSTDGKRFIRPNEILPPVYQDQAITTAAVNQIDPILIDYEVTAFTTLNIPLLFRPQAQIGSGQFNALRDSGQLTVIVYAATTDSEAQITLKDIAEDVAANPTGYGATANCEADNDGFLFPTAFTTALSGQAIAGYSQFDINNGIVNHILVGPTIPINTTGISFTKENNQLSLTFNGVSEFVGLKLYGFVVYRRYDFIIPPALANLQSNRFDIQILTNALDEFADPVTMEFAIEFLYKLKAFHSLLNVIRTRIELTETYAVTDTCVGGGYAQRYDIDAGRLQVPPAIIPRIPGDLSDCTLLDPNSLQYKSIDLQFRARLLTNLAEEHAAWKRLDGRAPGDPTRIQPNQPTDGRTSCVYTNYGQDRITTSERDQIYDVQAGPGQLANSGASGGTDLSVPDQSTSTNSDSSLYGRFLRELAEIPDPICALDKTTDYCYKGRVEDEILYRPTVVNTEFSGVRPFYLGLGIGVYWTYPTKSIVVRPGVARKDNRSSTNRISLSKTIDPMAIEYDYLSQTGKLPNDKRSMLGRLYRDYGINTPETLHFSNRLAVNDKPQLALQRPSLEISKPIMHFPGCRFPTMNLLEDDFESEYLARPWDAKACDRHYLNATLVASIDGERLSYDQTPLVVAGNNMVADIPSLGDHTLLTGALFGEDDVVHMVYMDGATDNPAVEFDGVVPLVSTVLDGTIDISSPLFSSYNTCFTDQSRFTDFADGYPAVTGFQNYVAPTVSYAELLAGIGYPSAGSITRSLFLLSSGVLDGSKGIRIDGGCSLVSCDDRQALCSVNQYLGDDGKLDFSPDHLALSVRLKSNESINTELILLDGTIPTLLETL